MNERIVTSASLLLLATPVCYAHGYTLADANHIIVILIIIVIASSGLEVTFYIITGFSVSETNSFDAFLRHWTITGPW